MSVGKFRRAKKARGRRGQVLTLGRDGGGGGGGGGPIRLREKYT